VSGTWELFAWSSPPPCEKNWKKKKTAPQHKMIARFCLGVPTLVPFWSQGHPAQEWKCVHVSENRVIVSKIFFNLVVNIPGSIGNFFYFVVYRNDNVSMHHIPSCIISSCIILYHQHKSYGTYVLCKEGWGKFQNNYTHKKLYRWTSRCLFTILYFLMYQKNQYIKFWKYMDKILSYFQVYG
jgi:hypothetical protein